MHDSHFLPHLGVLPHLSVQTPFELATQVLFQLNPEVRDSVQHILLEFATVELEQTKVILWLYLTISLPICFSQFVVLRLVLLLSHLLIVDLGTEAREDFCTRWTFDWGLRLGILVVVTVLLLFFFLVLRGQIILEDDPLQLK